jgi:hypothetical protein
MRQSCTTIAALSLLGLAGCAQLLGFEEREENDGPMGGQDGGTDIPRSDGGFIPIPPTDAGTGACSAAPQFKPSVAFGAGNEPASMAVGDLNKDGFKDVIMASRKLNELTILHGNGNGNLGGQQTVTFTPPQQCPAGVASVGVGDFDADGFQDIAYLSPGCGRLVVRRQGPAGVFQAEQALTVSPSAPRSPLATGDLDGDLRADLVYYGATNVQVFYGRSDVPGTFTPGLSEPMPNGSGPEGGAQIVDMNGDSLPDLLWSENDGVRYKVRVPGAPRTYGPTQSVGPGNLAGMGAGPLNADALVDLAIFSGSGGQVFLQDPADHSYLAGPSLVNGFHGPVQIVDVNDDGRNDLAVNNTIIPQCSQPSAPGTFPTQLGPGSVVTVVDAETVLYVDMTGDGKVDALGLRTIDGQIVFAVQM